MLLPAWDADKTDFLNTQKVLNEFQKWNDNVILSIHGLNEMRYL